MIIKLQTKKNYTKYIRNHRSESELSSGRMDPRVGSRFYRILASRVSTSDFFNFFTDYFLVPESIWIFEYYIRIDLFSTIFNIAYNNWIINK